ncbi:MAG: hypothetical protein SFU53_11230 [Terrimicrobiaceae bacterium]|nr:hypothetical protein [Terrimicrobiaceae bacterium]
MKTTNPCDARSLRWLLVLVSGICTAVLEAAPLDEWIRTGDAAEQRFETAAALEAYLAAEQLQPNNADLLVRIARQYRHLMTDAGSVEEKKRLGDLALEYSRRAALADPANSDAQIATGITLGKMMPVFNNDGKVRASRGIKASADRTLALDPRNDTAWHVLGRWQFGMAELTGVRRRLAQMRYGALPTATFGEAAKSFETARKLAPRRLMHTVELGITYAQMGHPREAKALLEEALTMPNREKDDPALKARAREVLQKL